MNITLVELGNTGITVTELCFGTLTMSPLQADMPPEQGGAVIRRAVEKGITFIDAAQGYRVYPHVKAGISGLNREELVIATKTHAHTAEEMQSAFDEACTEMGISYIDIFHLHLLKSRKDFDERSEALEHLKKLKSDGLVKAIGVSAHSIDPFRYVIDNPDIDIIYPTFNKAGLGINDGTIEEMAQVLAEAHERGKGIYAMKPLAGGHLRSKPVEALDFVRSFDFMDAVSIGMKDDKEVDFNIAYFSGEQIPETLYENVEEINRALMINGLCRKCGKCVEGCEQGALSLGESRAEVDLEKCIFCGYCGNECPVFAIRVI